MSELSVPAIIAYVGGQRLFKDYTVVAAVALAIYDYVLTLHLEIEHIWSSKWTYTKVVFLLIRYIPFVFSGLLLKHQTAIDLPESVCKRIFPVAVWMLHLNVLLSEIILTIRTWAIWSLNRIVGIGLATVTITFTIMICIFVNQTLQAVTYLPVLYPGFRGCLVLGNIRTALLHNYTVICITQFILLTLVATSAKFRLCKPRTNDDLSYIIHRDGIMFYVYLLGISVANITVVVTAELDKATSLIPLVVVLYSVFVTRTILNIRSAAATNGQLSTTELHTGNQLLQHSLAFVAVPASGFSLEESYGADSSSSSHIPMAI